MSNFFKKVSALSIITIMAVASLAMTASAENINANSRTFNSIRVINKNNKEVKFNVAAGVSYTEDQLIDIADSNLNGDNFEIYEIVYAQEETPNNDDVSQGNETRLGPIVKTVYTTTKTPTVTKALYGDYFVISVARGQETQLTTTWYQSLSASVSGSYKDYGNLGLNGTISKTYTKNDKFTGPPEGGNANSRMYYVKFYYNAGNWTQYYDEYDAFGNLMTAGFVKGTYTEPNCFVAYSFDVVA